MKVALDHHYSPVIAHRLRARGHDVVACVERGWEHDDDETLLSRCADEGRALLTNNVADFVVIARRWAAVGRSHEGLIFTADSSLPRTKSTLGRYVRLLDALCLRHPDSFEDSVHWL